MMELQEVTKIYDQGRRKVQALRGVSLRIMPGEFVSVMGPSGSGKSTLLHLLGTLDTPTTGRVLFDGRDLKALTDRQRSLLRRSRIGFIFQFFNLLPTLTAVENVCLPLMPRGSSASATAWSKRKKGCANAMRSLYRTLSLRYLRQRWSRAALVIATIALGVATLVATRTLNESMTAAARGASTPLAESADLVVSNGEAGVNPELAAELTRVTGVRQAEAMVDGRVRLPDLSTPETPRNARLPGV